MNRSATQVRQGFLSSRRAPYRVPAALLALLMVVSGCTKPGPKNVVSGTVKLNGQDVKGTVVIVDSDGKETASPISGGKYTIADPPLGDVVFLVKGMAGLPGPENPQKAEKPKLKGPADKILENTDRNMAVEPPRRYNTKETSDLKHTLKGGKETFDIELRP
jgi:hypothetical protein